MAHKLYVVVRDFFKQLNVKNISSFAASTAFFLFLSLVPMMIVVCTIIPYTPITEQTMLRAIMDILPDTMEPLMVSILADVYDKSAGILSVAAIATLWSAGKGVLALIRGLNEVNDVQEERNYFVLRAVASFYTVLLLLILIILLIFSVFGGMFVEEIMAKIPVTAWFFRGLMHFRFLAVWVVLTILFTMVYTYVPNKKLRFKAQIPGAAFSAVIWSLFSWGFSWYVEFSNGFSTYGNLSVIIIMMLWLYFCFYIILIGAQINRYFGPAYKMICR